MRSNDYCEVEMQELENLQRDLDEMETLTLAIQSIPLLGEQFIPTTNLSNNLTFSSVIRGIFSSKVHKQKGIVIHTIDSTTQCAPLQASVPYPIEEV